MEEIASGYGLIEGPVWDAAKGLYFSDVVNGGVYLLDRSDNISQVIPKRRGVGGMALHAADGLLVGGRDISFVSLGGGEGRVLLDRETADNATGFNDLTTDAAGRVYVGSLAYKVFGGEEPRPGNLYVIDLDGGVRRVSDGIMLTNGLGFSPDGQRLYHSDARADLVRVYDVSSDGSLSAWRQFVTLGPGGVADGLKVASDGSVWVADAHGGRVGVFDQSGKHLRDIAVPLPMVTSLCFAGDDLQDLYIVTGSRGGPHENCGTIYRMRVDIPGLALAPARVGEAERS
ncbi:MAG: SMP-30/gluconolactonase/LRE family protein [Hyphomicrobiaceae bacterium]